MLQICLLCVSVSIITEKNYNLMNKVTKPLGDFIQKEIIIPCYQRGYIWGKKHTGTDKDAVSYMLESLEKGFTSNEPLFIQGITVVEKNDSYVIIDGQQRMTFFYLLLKTLGDKKAFTIRYGSSRGAATDDEKTPLKSPQKWLEEYDVASVNSYQEDPEDEFQDIYYFKKTSRLITESELYKIAERGKSMDVCQYIKNNVEFLLIPINEQIAVRTFTMMNGNKAVMEGHELIKADLLRRASLGTGGYMGNASEWDNITLRNRYAHEWDRWLHWWNRKDVQLMYNCNNPMGWLLYCVFETEPDKADLFSTYSKYIDKRQEGKTESQKAKLIFARLRMLQNGFEEAYAETDIYNLLGIVTHILNKGDISRFINEYFSDNSILPRNLKVIYDLLLCGMTYNDILQLFSTTNYEDESEALKKLEQKLPVLRDSLVNNPVYGMSNDLAYKYLLIRNVEANTRGKFDFAILDGNRSLEHVYPKSKVVHVQDGQWMDYNNKPVPCLEGLEYEQERGWTKDGNQIENQEEVREYITRESIQKAASGIEALKEVAQDMTENSIGNLLLFYRKNNSEHGNKLPEIKRRDDFFNPSRPLFESRNLLHSLMVFGRAPHFDANAIAENQAEVLTDIDKRIDNLTKMMKREQA